MITKTRRLISSDFHLQISKRSYTERKTSRVGLKGRWGNLRSRLIVSLHAATLRSSHKTTGAFYLSELNGQTDQSVNRMRHSDGMVLRNLEK